MMVDVTAESAPTAKTSTRILSALSVVFIGLIFLGLRQLNNGLLTQIRTGTEILNSGHVLRADPYSFTAHGLAWTDQSWLVEIAYGVAYELAGLHAVLMVNFVAGILTLLTLLAICWRLSPLRIFIAAGIPTVLLTFQWAHRPLAFGVLYLALTILIFSRRLSPWWLLPIGWLWVNSHGSIIVGVIWAVAYLAGDYIDNHKRDKSTEKRVAALIAGYLLGALSPAGMKIVWFWTTPFGSRRPAFANSPDWVSPDFHSIGGAALGAMLLGSLVFAFSCGKQWRYRIPLFVLAIATLTSLRNLPFFAVALCPLMALAVSNVNIGERANKIFTTSLVGITITTGLLALGTAGSTLAASTSQLVRNYPLATVTWLHDQGLLNGEHRVAGREVVGNLIEWKYGTTAKVFIDDRFDMYPVEVSTDATDLWYMRQDPEKIIDRYDIDVLVVNQSMPLTQYLTTSDKWQQIHQDNGWLVFERN